MGADANDIGAQEDQNVGPKLQAKEELRVRGSRKKIAEFKQFLTQPVSKLNLKLPRHKPTILDSTAPI